MCCTHDLQVSFGFVSHDCCIGDGCIPVNALDWDKVGTENDSTKTALNGSVDSKAMIEANDWYSELNVMHAAVYFTVHAFSGTWYVLGTLRYANGFCTNTCCNGTEWYF